MCFYKHYSESDEQLQWHSTKMQCDVPQSVYNSVPLLFCVTPHHVLNSSPPSFLCLSPSLGEFTETP